MVLQNTSQEKLVIMRLIGGLGNQLFQMAAALSATNDSVILLTGLGAISNSPKMSADIQGFQLPNRVSVMHYDELGFPLSVRKPLSLLHRTGLRAAQSPLWRGFHRGLEHSISSFFSSASQKPISFHGCVGVGFDMSPRRPSDTAFMTGYFQSYRYFDAAQPMEPCQQIINKADERWLQDLQSAEKIEDPIVIHVRLGDYVGSNLFGTLSPYYYSSALDYLRSQGLVHSRLWVFSDEPSKVWDVLPESFRKLKPRVIENGQNGVHPTSVLSAMSLGHGLILANSSFSYWAATLSNCEDNLIVTPEPWFMGQDDPFELVPPNWHRVPR